MDEDDRKWFAQQARGRVCTICIISGVETPAVTGRWNDYAHAVWLCARCEREWDDPDLRGKAKEEP